jgi:hypothetical protein
MTTGFGVDPVITNNIPTKGMTSSDVRKVFGGLYSPGVISGAVVTTSGSSMTYNISAGVVAIPSGTGEVVLAPVAGQSKAVSNPGSSPRTDIIYVRQQFFGNDGDVEVIVGVNTSVPVGGLEIARYTVPANATNTNSALRTGSIDYSIPYGGSLGLLHSSASTFNGVPVETAGTDVYYLAGSFDLPTDRRLRFSVSISCSTQDGQDGTQGTWVEPMLAPQLDNVDLVNWTFRATGSWQTYFFSYDTILPVPAGPHTVRLRRNWYAATGRKPWIHYGGGQTGTTFAVTDLGVAK